MLNCTDNPGDSPEVLPWGQGQCYKEMVMVYQRETRIWRDFRSATKPSISDILLLSPPLQAACPRILQF